MCQGTFSLKNLYHSNISLMQKLILLINLIFIPLILFLINDRKEFGVDNKYVGSTDHLSCLTLTVGRNMHFFHSCL